MLKPISIKFPHKAIGDNFDILSSKEIYVLNSVITNSIIFAQSTLGVEKVGRQYSVTIFNPWTNVYVASRDIINDLNEEVCDFQKLSYGKFNTWSHLFVRLIGI